MKKIVSLLLFFITHNFYSQSIIQAEYFWDIDPGVGNGFLLIATDGDLSNVLESVITTNATLSNVGNHVLGVRIKDFNGNWSPLFRKVLSISSNTNSNNTVKISQAEYFWDNDPGEGAGLPLVAFDGNFNQALETVLNSNSSLPELGNHTIGVRVKSDNGIWSNVFKKVFKIVGTNNSNLACKVTQAEYFWDNDPGVGNGNSMLAFDGNFNNAIETIFSNSALLPTAGNHTIGIRIKTDDGNWSITFKKVFKLSENNSSNLASKITQAEYFWNNDPEQGNGVFMLAFDGNYNNALESVLANSENLPSAGVNLLSIRLKSDDGNWGTVYSKVVGIDIVYNTQVILISPSNSATNIALNSSFVWNQTATANTYRYQCSTDNLFNTIIQTGLVTDLSIPFTQLVANTTYYWRVRAEVSGNVSLWSDVWSFTTETNLNNETFSISDNSIITPNPTSNFLEMKSNFEMKDFNYSIFSIDGKEIISGIFNEKEKINVQNLHSGVYFIQFKKNNISYKNFKFIKE
jgi:Secretion system C-terminal sorting domain